MVFSQLIDTDQNPPGVKWRQIETVNFKLIYPKELQTEAERMANTLEYVIGKISYSLHKKPRKLSIILQNRGVESNGFVQLAPRKSEFFSTPPQSMDPQDWLNSLALHEPRHIIQMDKMSVYLSAPFFEQLALAIFGVPLPPWFYEGDAVITETLLSSAGRGRIPSFEMALRTNLLSGRRYGYQKDFFGSLKSVTPGYYPLGFFMTTKLRRDYPMGHDSLLSAVAHQPYWPYSFSKNLKAITGFRTRGWHYQTMDELRQKWQQQYALNKPDSIPILPANPKGKVMDLLLPQQAPDGLVYALHKNLVSVPEVVVIFPDGHLQKVVATGVQLAPHFSYGGGKLTWDEMRYHQRFFKENYSVVNLYDLRLKKYRQLTHKTRLFSPALNADGTKIAAVEVGLDNRISVVLLDTKGKLLKRFSAPPKLMLQTPAFNAASTKLLLVGVSQDGASLLELDVNTGVYTTYLSGQKQQIERPVYAGDDILFKAHYNGIDNLYRMSTGTRQIAQVTNAPFGAFNPSYRSNTNELYFNNYRLGGYGISHLNLSGVKPLPIEKIKNTFTNYTEPLLKQELPPVAFDSVPQVIYPSKSYRDVPHMINFHSLSVNNGDFSSLDNFKPGIQWISDNLLNTTSAQIGWNYDPDIHSSSYTANLTYQRFLPKISLSYANQGELSSAILHKNDKMPTSFRWRENVASLSVEIPFRFSQLNHVYTFGFNAATSYTSRYNLSLPELEGRLASTISFPLAYQIYLNHNLMRSTRDLAPRWGQNLTLIYRMAPFDKGMNGNMSSLRATLYFPGLFPNHSFQARFGYQRKFGIFGANNDIFRVSGYDQLKATRPDNSLLFSYRLPLAYPDWGIGNLAYIKRFYGGFFADFEDVNSHHRFSPRTFGAELRASMNLMRFYLPDFDAGIKLIYVNETAPNKIIWTYGVTYSY